MIIKSWYFRVLKLKSHIRVLSGSQKPKHNPEPGITNFKPGNRPKPRFPALIRAQNGPEIDFSKFWDWARDTFADSWYWEEK